MPKTFPIIIDVEEIALGTVLRKLNDMAGIAKLHLDLGRGGESGQQAIATRRFRIASAGQPAKPRRSNCSRTARDITAKFESDSAARPVSTL